MEERVKEFILQNHILDGVCHAVLAVSGGADYMAMAHLLKRLFPALRFTAAHVNHGLRVDAGEDEELVRRFAAEQGFAFQCARRDIAAIARAKKQGLEETGREERYRFFRSLGADRILTAHHMGDQAETVLLHLIRGAGLKGLSGIAPLDGDIGRPLLTVTKEELIAYCEEHGVPYRYDTTNSDETYTRNKVRGELLPLIKTINPAAERSLCRLAAVAAEDEAYLAKAAEAAFAAVSRGEGDFLLLSAGETLRLEPALRRRVFRLAAIRFGVSLDFEKTERIGGLRVGGEMPLGGNVTARRESACFRFGPAPFNAVPADAVVLPMTGTTPFGGGRCAVTEVTAAKHRGDVGKEGFFDLSLFVSAPPVLRSRRRGDYVLLKGGHRKKLSDYFIDEKIPRSRRDETLLLTVGQRVLWVVGHRFFAESGERNLRIRIRQKNS